MTGFPGSQDRWRTALNLLMLFIFVCSALLQYNDSDGLVWGGLYLLASGCCLGAHLNRLHPKVAALFSSVAWSWALVLGLSVPGGTDTWLSLSDWRMSEVGSELVREVGGLSVTGFWMAVLYFWSE